MSRFVLKPVCKEAYTPFFHRFTRGNLLKSVNIATLQTGFFLLPKSSIILYYFTTFQTGLCWGVSIYIPSFQTGLDCGAGHIFIRFPEGPRIKKPR